MIDPPGMGPRDTAPGIIDVHAHVVSDAYLDLLREAGFSQPGYGAPSSRGAARPSPAPAARADAAGLLARIEAMDAAGVARQILSPTFAPYLRDADAAVRAARVANNLHEEIAAAHAGRFSAFAALPLPHVDAALAELDRLSGREAFVGVGLHCACLGRSVVSEDFERVYAALDARRAVIFFHPSVDGLGASALCDWRLQPTLGVLSEDAAVALHLVVRRLPTRFPNLRFVIPHLGGPLPMMLNRLDNQLSLSWPDLPEAPSATLRRFFYDTVTHGSAAAFRCGLEAFGPRALLTGSDYPVPLAFEGYSAAVGFAKGQGLPAAELAAVLRGTAERLLTRPIA